METGTSTHRGWPCAACLFIDNRLQVSSVLGWQFWIPNVQWQHWILNGQHFRVENALFFSCNHIFLVNEKPVFCTWSTSTLSEVWSLRGKVLWQNWDQLQSRKNKMWGWRLAYFLSSTASLSSYWPSAIIQRKGLIFNSPSVILTLRWASKSSFQWHWIFHETTVCKSRSS